MKRSETEGQVPVSHSEIIEKLEKDENRWLGSGPNPKFSGLAPALKNTPRHRSAWSPVGAFSIIYELCCICEHDGALLKNVKKVVGLQPFWKYFVS